MNPKKSVATVSLAGCFGCHMSLLDMDLRVVKLLADVELYRSPLCDRKNFDKRVDIGIIEGGVCNDENVYVLREFRKHCHVLVSIGECAIMGGLPALRNNVDLRACLKEAYYEGITTHNPKKLFPHHEDIPQILDKVYPCHEVVKIDHFIPGCPPSGDAIWEVLSALIHNQEPSLSYENLKYD